MAEPEKVLMEVQRYSVSIDGRRHAEVNEAGEITFGPGPHMTEKSVEVIQVGRDLDLEQGPDYKYYRRDVVVRVDAAEMVFPNGKPVETYTYTLNPNALQAMEEEIDKDTGYGELERAAELLEAERVMYSIASGEILQPAMFSLLQDDIGDLIHPATKAPCVDVEEVAEAILDRTNVWKKVQTTKKAKRKLHKKALRAAKTDDEIIKNYKTAKADVG